MATPPPVPDVEPYAGEDQAPAELPVEHTNGTTAPVDEVLPAPEPQSPAAEYAEPSAASAKSDSQMPREKQVKVPWSLYSVFYLCPRSCSGRLCSISQKEIPFPCYALGGHPSLGFIS